MGTLQCIFALLGAAPLAHAAVHEYHRNQFVTVADALLFKAGHEGIFHSRASSVNALDLEGPMPPGVLASAHHLMPIACGAN